MRTRFTQGVSAGATTGGIVRSSASEITPGDCGSMRTFCTTLTSEPGAALKRCPSPASMCAQMVCPSARRNCV
jgi:hypothetical protein